MDAGVVGVSGESVLTPLGGTVEGVLARVLGPVVVGARVGDGTLDGVRAGEAGFDGVRAVDPAVEGVRAGGGAAVVPTGAGGTVEPFRVMSESPLL